MGPPLAKIVGMLARMAPRIMPGTILSQLGMQIMASKQWALTIDSTQSAMSSRLGSEYFMPSWPMAMPSQMPIVLNSKGTPPASRMHCLIHSATLFRWQWPGMISTKELQTAMKGFLKSSRLTPVAMKRLRCGARWKPVLT